jgi:RNA 3'-terminal phosphate cyclase (ATP)
MGMNVIDGSVGEGGGQILRTCLSLSLITGQPFRIKNIRKNRKRPGLRAQHLSSIELAAKIGDADVKGAKLNSPEITFTPRAIRAGDYRCTIGTAGSTSLVLQSVFLPLGLVDKSSSISITGGTHVPWSPTFDYLHQNWTPFLNNIGFQISVNLVRAGFYPQGGGQIQATIRPLRELSGIKITQRGNLKQIRGISAVSNLDRRIAERQRAQVLRRIGDKFLLNDIRIQDLPSKFKGTSLSLICEFENSHCCYCALGALGKPAERVADEVIDKIEYFMTTDAVVDEYMADQLLLPLSIAKSDSQYITPVITRHLITNADIISRFLPAQITIDGEIGDQGTIFVVPGST